MRNQGGLGGRPPTIRELCPHTKDDGNPVRVSLGGVPPAFLGRFGAPSLGRGGLCAARRVLVLVIVSPSGEHCARVVRPSLRLHPYSANRFAVLVYLLFLFVSVPLIELAILLYLATHMSLAGTLLLVLVTGVVGATLARRQGWITYVRIQQELAAGRMPNESLWDAAMIFIAGAVLLTPGILTDVLGFTLLLPSCRRFYQRRLLHWIKRRVHFHTVTRNTQDQIIDSFVVDKSTDRTDE